MRLSDPAALRLRILGRVQGVGYRDWTIRTARALGLTGWVRNLTDGSVEVLAQGPQTTLTSFIAACRAGPPGAHVTDVRSAAAALEPGTGFRQLPTAGPQS